MCLSLNVRALPTKEDPDSNRFTKSSSSYCTGDPSATIHFSTLVVQQSLVLVEAFPIPSHKVRKVLKDRLCGPSCLGVLVSG